MHGIMNRKFRDNRAYPILQRNNTTFVPHAKEPIMTTITLVTAVFATAAILARIVFFTR